MDRAALALRGRRADGGGGRAACDGAGPDRVGRSGMCRCGAGARRRLFLDDRCARGRGFGDHRPEQGRLDLLPPLEGGGRRPRGRGVGGVVAGAVGGGAREGHRGPYRRVRGGRHVREQGRLGRGGRAALQRVVLLPGVVRLRARRRGAPRRLGLQLLLGGQLEQQPCGGACPRTRGAGCSHRRGGIVGELSRHRYRRLARPRA
mmetsp:Transcript_32787/g.94041  ORF Transcript_32787/g.94041 Transcript_32787/m.94041 type:complete len:204 (+) Transcript_32787:412-1023(+)